MDAVVPVAGLGTRLEPLTRVVPKELLPLDGRPIIAHVAAELRAAGIERVCLVTRPGKAPIEDQFDGEPWVCAVRQPEPRGLGDAVACAEAAVDGRPFVVALGDCVYRTPAVIDALLAAHADDPGAAAILAVERVPPERVSRYGIVALEGAHVTGLVEKPAPEDAPSDLAIAGRYLLSPAIFGALRAGVPDPNGELGLTGALGALIDAGERVVAVEVPADERRYDIGDIGAYTEAFVDFALARDPGLAERARAAGAR
jgi:UTP--glucose-1-phosphate uridylyltransferase